MLLELSSLLSLGQSKRWASKVHMNKKQSGEFITASIFHSPPLFQPEWPSDFPSALLALVSVSPHAALGRAPASLPQLHVPPTSELVLRVRVQPKRVQCILRSTCAPFIILSPQASPCPLLYSRVSVHCSVTCVSVSCRDNDRPVFKESCLPFQFSVRPDCVVKSQACA